MQPHQQRVVEEKTELDEKIRKLGSFLTTSMFKDLPGDEQTRLSSQWGIMMSYSRILGERIAAF